MPRPMPKQSPVTGKDVPSYYIHASDAFFRDTSGRALLLRGVNLSDSSKAPPGQTTFDDPETLWGKAEAGGESFVGRPLRLDDGSADVHLTRLKAWGFNTFRYVFTWEALEHAGPGKYDYEYMDYTVQVLRKVKSYGFRVFMDPHQDLFSRFTGGSGAPYWVLPACGIDHKNITATQAAFLQYEYPSPDAPDPQSFPAMIWATNYTRLAAATLGAFFFGGRDFAPKCVIDGQNIQDWLQGHFIESVRQLAVRIHEAGDLEDVCVIGWDSMNEPNPAYIGIEKFDEIPEKWPLKKGPVPSPLQSMRLGMGTKQVVQNWFFSALGPKRQKDVEIDPQGKSLWLSKEEDATRGGSKWGWKRGDEWPLGTCPWAAHGAWDVSTGDVLEPEYFKYYKGTEPPRTVDFVEDYWLPFWRAYSKAIRSVHKEAIVFIQTPVFEPPPKSMNGQDLQSRACTSQHFYDGLTLITKHWNWFNADAVGLLRGKYPGVLFALKVGLRAIRQGMRDQLGYLREDTLSVLGKYPTLIGEIGIPFDLDERKTYYGDSKGNGIGDYRNQATALDASLNACDGTNVLSFTAWSYNPFNSHEFGDSWNGEDFSIWSQDDIKYVNLDSQAPDVIDDEAKPAIFLSEPDSNLSSSSSSTPAATDGANTPIIGGSSSSSMMIGVAHESNAAHIPAITNGSRCSQAFCRPYPIATTGTPIEINFDIKSSEFSYTLDANKDDLEPDASGTYLPTEIFLPFIHYASDSLAGAASGNVCDAGKDSPKRKADRSRASSLRKEISRQNSRDLSQSVDSLSTFQGGEDPRKMLVRTNSSQSGLAPFTSPSVDAARSSLSLNSSTTKASTKDKLRSRAKSDQALERFTLDLEVTVSAGVWEVEPGSQVLKWYLPKPGTQSGSTGPASPGRHKITVKRRGGPIAFTQSASAFELLVEQGMRWLRSIVQAFVRLFG